MVNTRLSERDLRVIVKCAVGSWLTTGQLQRLCFGQVSADAARKSLRRLADNGYLVAHRDHSMAEMLHSLGPQGKVELAKRGLNIEAARGLPRQVEHLIGINDIRVAVEKAGMGARYCLASWELQALGWSSPIIPDLVAAFRSPEKLCISFEYDRGTEGLTTFARKLRWYESASVPFTALVLVADGANRLETLGRKVRELACLRPISGCVLSELSECGVDARIFTDFRRQSVKVGLFEVVQ